MMECFRRVQGNPPTKPLLFFQESPVGSLREALLYSSILFELQNLESACQSFVQILLN